MDIEGLYGNRIDGTPKGLTGWLGNIPSVNNTIANELSVTVDFGDGDVLAPLLNPYNKEHAEYLARGEKPTPEMFDNAARWAFDRARQNMSPFMSHTEQLKQLKSEMMNSVGDR